MSVPTSNQNLTIVNSQGGAVRVTLSSNVGQGNGGTSLPCKMCWISSTAANTEPTKVNIGAAASASLGVDIPGADVGGPLMVPIDDVSKLFFYSGSPTGTIDITYVL